MENNNQEKKSSKDYKKFLTPSDSPSSPSRSSPQKKESSSYQKLREEYQSMAHKEQVVQSIGTLFALFASGIELFVFLIVIKVMEFNISIDLLLYYLSIFFVLLIIVLFTLFQLWIIKKWNRKVNDIENSLTGINYSIIDWARTFQATSYILLLLNGLFLYLYYQLKLPSPDRKFFIVVILYSFLSRLSFYLIVGFTFLELWQLIKWTKKIKQSKKIEEFLLSELSDIHELEILIEQEHMPLDV